MLHPFVGNAIQSSHTRLFEAIEWQNSFTLPCALFFCHRMQFLIVMASETLTDNVSANDFDTFCATKYLSIGSTSKSISRHKLDRIVNSLSGQSEGRALQFWIKKKGLTLQDYPSL